MLFNLNVIVGLDESTIQCLNNLIAAIATVKGTAELTATTEVKSDAVATAEVATEVKESTPATQEQAPVTPEPTPATAVPKTTQETPPVPTTTQEAPAIPADDATVYSIVEMRAALLELRNKHSKEVAKAALNSIGYEKLSGVPAELYGTLMAKIKEMM